MDNQSKTSRRPLSGSLLNKTPLSLAIVAALSIAPASLASPGDVLDEFFMSADDAISEVAMDADGDFVVAWRNSSNVFYRDRGYLYFSLYDKSGASVVKEKPVTFKGNPNTACHSVAMDDDGDFVIAWTDFYFYGPGYGNAETRFQLFKRDGNPGSPIKTVSSGTKLFGCPKVAMDDDGDFVIALNGDSYYGYSGLYAQTFYGPENSALAGTSRTPIVEITNGRVENFPFANHAVAMDSDGDSVIAFVQYDNVYNYYFPYIAKGLNYVRLSLKGEPGDNANLGSTVYSAPDVAIDNDGDFVVVARDGNNVDAFMYDYDGSTVGLYPSISSMTVANGVPASVSMDADGDFNVASFPGGGGNKYLYIDRFDLKGNPLPPGTGLIQTKSRFSGHGSPSIAMDADGDFVASAFDYDYKQVVATRFDGPDPVVDLGLGVTAASSVDVSSTLVYNVVLNNNGSDPTSDPAEGVSVNFTQTAGSAVTFNTYSGAGWSCPPLPTATTGPLTCNYALPLATGSLAPPLNVNVTTSATTGAITMRVIASSNSTDEAPLNNIRNKDTVVESSDLDLVLSFVDGVTQVFTGNILTYAASIANVSASRSATGVQISMPIETGLAYNSYTGTNWTCDDVTVAGEVTCVYGLTLGPASNTTASPLNIIMDTVSAGAVSSTATVTLNEGDIDFTNNSVTDDVSIINNEVNLALTLVGQASVGNGGELSYTATVSNSSTNSIDATGVSMSVLLDSGLTYVSATGTNWTCGAVVNTVNCTYSLPLTTATAAPPVTIVATAPVATGTVTTSGNVLSTEADEDVLDNSASYDTSIFQETVDLAINSSSPTAATAGGTVSYVLSASNGSATATATGISIQTVLDASLTAINAPGGAGWSCGVVTSTVTCNYSSAVVAAASTPDVTVTATAPASGSLSTTSTVTSSDQLEANIGDNSITDVTDIVAAFVDLSLSLTDGLAQAFTGTTLTYATTVNNAHVSAVPATNVTVTVDLPSGTTFVSNSNVDWTCNPTGLDVITCIYSGAGIPAGGGSSIFNILVTAPATAGVIATTAALTTSQNDLSAADNLAVDNDTNVIENKADLSVIFSDGLSITQLNDNMLYVASVTNNDVNGIDATGFTLLVNLDTTLVFQAASSFDFACGVADASNAVTCTYAGPDLAQGETVSAYFFAAAPATAISLSSTASVNTVAPGDLNSLNNSATDVTSVINQLVDLTLDMTGGSTEIVIGAPEKYTATVTNNVVLGADATGISVDFNLSDQLTFDSYFGTDWTCAELIGIVTCTYSQSLAPLAVTPTVEINTTASQVAGAIASYGVVSASLTDSNAVDNSVTVNNEIVSTALDLELTLVDGEDFVAVDKPMTYVATVTNKFGSLFNATGTAITFTLDPGLTYVSGTGTDWTCVVDTISGLKCFYSQPLFPGASTSVTIAVTTPSVEGKISSSASVNSNQLEKALSNNVSDEGTVITVANTGGSLGWLTSLYMLMVMSLLRKCSNQAHRKNKL